MRLAIRSLARASTAALLGLGGLGCSSPDVSSVTAIYALPASLDELAAERFFEHPWPSDLRLVDGRPYFGGYGNPLAFPLLDQYIESTTGLLDGFSPAGAGYLRFTGPIDASTLPATPRDAQNPDASVQLIDIDPTSPEHGQRKLVSLQWRAPKGVYYQANTLAFMPTIGFPLRPHTRYALVVTDDLKAAEGGAIAQLPELAEVVGVEPFDGQTRTARATLAPAVKEIVAAGIEAERIVHLSVFTTADPTKELEQIADALPSLVSAPSADPAKWKPGFSTSEYDEYLGTYGPTPNFQHGALPFGLYGEGGGFEFEGGAPVLAGTFNLRFSITVPKAAKCPMPADGYPIVLYAHGTGGHFRSYVEDGTGALLATHCLATMGIDQIFHGIRPGAPMDLNELQILFFNFQNPVAARTNGRQAAIDEIQRARLFTETHMVVPAAKSVTGEDVRFDGSKVMYFGHSQGGLNGPLYTAVDRSARGAVFSGAGAQISIALLEKTQPEPSVAALVKTLLLGLKPDEEEELDVFHPALSLAQAIVDTVDPLHYGRLQHLDPRPGFPPKSIYMTEGINPDGVGDSYAPPHGIEAHALATGLPLQLPKVHEIAEAAWGGPLPVSVPAGGLAGNLGNGLASGVLAQWPWVAGSDGHFVVFEVPGAREQSAQFLENLAASPVGKVPAP